LGDFYAPGGIGALDEFWSPDDLEIPKPHKQHG
jgi:hypothetical protein